MKIDNFKMGMLITLMGLVGVIVTCWELVATFIVWTFETFRAICRGLWDLSKRLWWIWVIWALILILMAITGKSFAYDNDTVVYPTGARVVVDMMCVDGIQTVEYSFSATDTIQHRYRIPGLSEWPNINTLGYTSQDGTSDVITTTAHNLNQPGSVIIWGLACGTPAPPIYSADFEILAPVVLLEDQPIQHDPYPTPTP